MSFQNLVQFGLFSSENDPGEIEASIVIFSIVKSYVELATTDALNIVYVQLR